MKDLQAKKVILNGLSATAEERYKLRKSVLGNAGWDELQQLPRDDE